MNKTETFIAKATTIHGTTYDYSKVNYKNNEIKITIICKEHGEFEQSPKNHLLGRGCIKCGNNKVKKAHAFTTDEFIEKAKNINGDKYDYSKINYINNDTKITITCSIHSI